MKPRAFAAALALAAALTIALFSACVNTKPVIHPEVTAPPTQRAGMQTPIPTEEPDLPATPAPTADQGEAVDAMGNVIAGAEHYSRYIKFLNILVYEEYGDTFMDGIIENSYLFPITCVIDAVFDDDDGTELARARLQTRDGSYLLILPPGETVFFAHVLTDTKLTNVEFRFEFDKDTAIEPVLGSGN